MAATKKHIEANSEAGTTASLIDAIITICSVLDGRDMFDDDGIIKEAIADLRSNDTMKMLMDIGDLQDAKDYIEEQKKTINILLNAGEIRKAQKNNYMSTFYVRLLKEKNDLDDKIAKLLSFLESEKALRIEPLQASLLQIQLNAMLTYTQILATRLQHIETTTANV